MANEVFINPQGYIEIVYEGKQTADTVLDVVYRVKAIAESLIEQKKSPKLIIDISKSGGFTTEARHIIFQGLQGNVQEKIAIFGATGFLKYAVKLFVRGVRRPSDTYRYFDTRAEAEAWLAEDVAK